MRSLFPLALHPWLLLIVDEPAMKHGPVCCLLAQVDDQEDRDDLLTVVKDKKLV